MDTGDGEVIIPLYFEPFERKNVNLDFHLLDTHKDRPVRVFGGDGDADRPDIL